MVEDETHQVKGRSLYVVAHGYIMYFTMVMSVSLLNDRASLHADLESACIERGVFLHPYYVIQFANLMRRVVGRSMISAKGLDDILSQLLIYTQECVNNPGSQEAVWSGDSALRYICNKVVENVALVTARNHVEADEECDERSEPKKKAKVGGNGGRTVAPKTNKKCQTCSGFASHESGRCSRCRQAEKRQLSQHQSQRQAGAAVAQGGE